MPVVEHEAEIQASPETVFALICRVEEFTRYSDTIETITRLDDKRYRWQVRAAGLPLSFDVEITESVPHERFAWRSVTGIESRGCYRLTPIAGGTRIHLWLEYSIQNPLVEEAVDMAAKPLIHKISREIIENVEASLKEEHRKPH